MRTIFLLVFIISTICSLKAQAPQANELVKIHEVTTTEMNNIASPLVGSFVFNTTLNKMFFFDGTTWSQFKSGQTSYPGHFIINGTGSQTITGLPFEPKAIVFAGHPNIETTSINSDNAVGNNNNTLQNSFGTMNGYARNDNGTINQQVIYVGGNGNSINDISRYANSGECIGVRYGNQNGDQVGLTTAILTAFTTDGFIVNVNNHSDNLVITFTAYE
ncbi:hypothetical protein GH721_03015 [Kriegella sp. EG-1]|nr:hypothetical protein [Flavobacteriaceae bacterium EG-1]